ncbi:MAG TPA: amino acid adenylation domain-containing protein, partial [Terriglobales bacterium]|nr:amino acid adenylation domain-containing protein [Terriglobales bacterium]
MKVENLEDVYELSPLQRGMLFHCLQSPDSAFYLEQFHLTFSGDLNLECFRRAWEFVLARHPVLRSAFFWEDLEKPYQVVYREVVLPWENLDCSAYSASEQQQKLAAFIQEDRKRQFVFSDAPLMRVALFDLGEKKHEFVWSFHHLLLDGWSVTLLLQEVFAAYRASCDGQEPAFDAVHPYRDYIVWSQKQDQSKAESYWREALRGFTTPVQLSLACGRPIAAASQERNQIQTLQLSAEATTALRDLSRRRQLTMNTLFQAAWAILLSRYCHQNDVAWGAVVSGRPAALPDSESIIGLFINTLPMRAQIIPEMPLLEWANKLQAASVDLREYEYSSLVDVRRWSDAPRDVPLFDTIVAFENILTDASLARPAENLAIGSARVLEATNYPLSVKVVPGPSLAVSILYDGGRFEGEVVGRMLAHLETLLNAIANDAHRTLAELPMLTESERKQIVVEWNRTETDYPRQLCAHEVFEQQARLMPDAVAVDYAGRQLSYGELNRRANQVAHYLRKKGVGPEVLVGVCLEWSVELIVGLVGIVKAGGAYVPLDAEYPPERLAFMLQDAGVRVLVTQQSLRDKLAAHGTEIVCLDLDSAVIAEQSDQDVESGAKPENLIYVMYTSGSTGQPKGICIPHRAVNRLVLNTNYVELNESDRIAQASNVSFDAATFEIWGALLHGATLVGIRKNVMLSPQEFAATLLREKISVLFLTTALFNQLAREAPDAFKNLRVLLFGGEAVDPRWVAAVVCNGKPQHLLHVYGPTETTTYASWYEVKAVEEEAVTVPIGRPLANTDIYILDADRHPVPVGVAGEIYIGGDGVARGYLRREELTAEKFVAHPFREEKEAKLYRTGDLGRYRDDGSIEFVGRIDHQVKIRGFRIELGEIEAVLSAQGNVREAVVVYDGTPGKTRLIAYLVPARQPWPTIGDIRNYLKEKLPEYMVPAAFVFLEKLPLTPNGKVDRKALPSPDAARPDLETQYIAPGNDAEKTIATIWQEALQVEKVGLHDNFFDLGGDSLLVTQVYGRLRNMFEGKLSIIDLFKYPTVSALAKYVNDYDREPSLVEPKKAPATPAQNEPIAVIAMVGRFPGAQNVDELWQNLRSGKECIRRFTDEELKSAGVDDALLSDASYVRAGAILDGADRFDARFFDFNAREAEITDPQHRVFLECAHQALETAGYDARSYSGRIGVYAGATISSYLANNLYGNPLLAGTAGTFQVLVGNDKDFMPTRVSYKLNLRGPSINIQTACSTSLVAVHLACRALLEGACDIALAGGVSVRFPQTAGYKYEEDGILSPDGHCRSFDAKARGTIAGSGAGIVVLKRLSQAIADGDTVEAIILGSAVNNDGSQKIGYTAPSVEGQAQVIAAAQELAGVDAGDISYIEAHGTATPLGDPIEIEALTQAFRRNTPATSFCAIGSVKTNLGHLDAAAGVTGLIKTVLQLKNRELAPSLHFQEPNPKIDFPNTPFVVNRELKPWVSNGKRRAGVSSFGMGGTNAHLIVEEAPEQAQSDPSNGWELLTLSAKTPAAAQQASQDLANYLAGHAEENLADIAYTLHVGRTAHPHRIAVVCQNAGDAQHTLGERTLEGSALPNVFTSSPEQPNRTLVFMFPGQGAQHVNMGKDLYQSEPRFRQEVDRCAELLQPELGADLRRILYPEPGQENQAAQQLQQTAITQPALFTIEYALAKLWMSWGVCPDAMIGHSIGEYVAACLAGVFSLEDALATVAARGRLMQSVEAGAMVVAPISEYELKPLLNGELSLAAVNAPSLCVVSGASPAIEHFESEMNAKGVECRRLHTSHAFHSGMMDPILEPFAAQLKKMRLKPSSIPYISNLTGSWIDAADATSPHYWVEHLRRTVRFAEGVTRLLDDDKRVLLEAGPGQTLSELVKQQTGRDGSHVVVPSMRHVRQSTSDLSAVLGAVGRLWVSGIEINWTEVHAGQKRRRLRLPTYPFERRSFFIEPRRGDATALQSCAPSSKRKPLNDWFYVPSWKLSVPPRRAETVQPSAQNHCWLVFLDDCGFGLAFVNRLRRQGQEVLTVSPGKKFSAGDGFTIDPDRAGDYDFLFQELQIRGKMPQTIVHLWSFTEPEGASSTLDSTERCLTHSFYSLIYLTQALAKAEISQQVGLAVVSNNMQAVTDGEQVCPAKAALLGCCLVIPQEHANIACRSIDLSYAATHRMQNRLLDQLSAELSYESADAIIAYRGRLRYVRSYEPVQLEAAAVTKPKLRESGVYLITGGLGGVGLEIAGYLARAAHARLILVGRSEFPARENWAHWLATHPSDESTSRKIQKLQAIERLGAEVLIVRADVASEAELRVGLALARNHFGAIHGVIHAAGVAGGGLIQRQTRELADPVLAAKIAGTQLLDRLLRDEDLDFMVLCSSQRSILGAPGRAEYCAANAFLDAFVAAKSGSDTFTTSIVWDSWKEVGMAVLNQAEPGVGEIFEGAVQAAMRNEEGVEVFERVLHSGLPVVIVSTQDLEFRIAEHKALNTAQILGHYEQVKRVSAAHPRPELKTSYLAPRNKSEEVLAEIWARLLGVDRIGVNDNFFELGGDSVISIQIIAQANQAGIRLTVKQMFTHPTVAALAAVAGASSSRAIAGIQGVEGPVPLTPIQEWFFEQNIADSHHFNQAVLLQLTQPVDPVLLQKAVGHLVEHHDALRTRFIRKEGRWLQAEMDVASRFVFTSHDLTSSGDETLKRFIEEEAARQQKALNFSDGPIFGVTHWDCGPERPSRLLLVIHHLVVDLVSWRILLEDLQTVYQQLHRGLSVQLPGKTTSFRYWSQKLAEKSRSGSFLEERSYWLEESRKKVSPLPVDDPQGEAFTVQASARTCTVQIDAEETKTLLQQLPQVFSAKINDALLSALLRAFRRWTGEPRLLIDLEGLGREPISEDIDLSRTVGWFTSVYPVLLEFEGEWKPTDVLSSVQKQLRRIPNGGIGYGALRYLSGGDPEISAQLREAPHPEICFLYQGQVDNFFAQNALFLPAQESSGPDMSPRAALSHRMIINGLVKDGCLRFDWTYSENLYRRETIEKLAQDFAQGLSLLVAHCRAAQQGLADIAVGDFSWDTPQSDLILSAVQQQPGSIVNVECFYPLSPMQQGMLFHTLYAPELSEYFRQVSFVIDGDVDVNALQAAWQKVIDRHSILRSAFFWPENADPVQVVQRNVPGAWQILDWRDRSEVEQRQSLQSFLEEDQKKGFTLTQAPLMRCALMQSGARKHIFVWSFHHLVLDGWSASRLMGEVFAWYDAYWHGTAIRLQQPAPYREYILWLQQQDLSKAEKYWRNYLKGIASPTPLGVDTTVSVGQRKYEELRGTLSSRMTSQLRAWAQQNGLTLNTVMQGAWALLLGRYSGESEVLFGATVSGRPPEIAGVDSMVGVLINTLPVRVSLAYEGCLVDWLQKLQGEQAEAREYEYSPLVEVHGWSEIPRSQPLFESIMVFENYPVAGSIQSQDQQLSISEVTSFERTNYPLTVMVCFGTEVSILMDYDSSRFDSTAIARMLRHYQNLLEELLRTPDRTPATLPLLGAEERRQVVEEWNTTGMEYDEQASIPDLVGEQAKRRPQAVAVRCGEEVLSYQELEQRSNRLARRLRKLGVGREQLVGICVERSVRMVVGLLGIMKAGAAYVPLDPSFPAERLRYMLEDAEAKVVITEAGVGEEVVRGYQGAVFYLDEEWERLRAEDKEGEESKAEEYTAGKAQTHDLAYVMYTSGSTGKPKGVMIEQGAVVNFLEAMRRELEIGETDRWLAVTTISFDIAGLELYLPLAVGAEVEVVSREEARDGERLRARLESGEVTVMQATPATWRLLVESGWRGTEAKGLKVLCGGEALTRELANELQQRAGRVWNLYGPTETTIWSMVEELGKETKETKKEANQEAGPVLIGKPIGNTQVYVLDERGEVAPIGVQGELCIGGRGVARGYWRRPELSGEKFVANPFIAGERMYRTGDMARWRRDGRMEYLGRRDQQVKVRGYRIELGEIESVLRQAEGIRECVVV